MFWLRNKKIKFSLHTLNLSPDKVSHLAGAWGHFSVEVILDCHQGLNIAQDKGPNSK